MHHGGGNRYAEFVMVLVRGSGGGFMKTFVGL